MSAHPATGDAVALARAMIAIDSRNPTLTSAAPGEGAVASLLAAALEAWGFAVELTEAAPGRPNVVARIGSGERVLLFAGHLDTVGIEGMTHPPFEPTIADGKLYGRGSADMKAGVAAMCAAAANSVTAARCTVIVAAVCDEEYESLGMRALLAGGVRAEAAVITEPTGLAICPAHRGFVWALLRFRGRAAHGSRYDIGVDAIRHAGLFLAELDAHDGSVLSARAHPLLGRGSVHASTITGGVGFSTYPEECVLRIERRTLPGETTEAVMAELQRIADAVRMREPQLNVAIELVGAQPPSDVSSAAPIVASLRSAMEQDGMQPRIEGMSAWTDAALLNAAGIPAICFGPGDVALAHAPEEYIAVDDIRRAVSVLERLVRNWGRDP